MATPQDSITTVGGRRCTRSRARTAATSILTSAAAETTPTELTSSSSEAQQIQSSAAAPPDPPPSSAPPAASSAIGTDSPVSSAAQLSPLANLAPSPPAAVVPDPGAVVSQAEVETQAAAAPSAAPSSSSVPTTTSAASSDSNNAAVTSAPSISSAVVPSESSVETSPEGSQQSAQPVLPSDQQPNDQPAQPTSTGVPSGGSAGIIAPEQGGDTGSGLTIANGGNTNIGGIVGGVVGGFAGLALISVLLFLCLRKRRSKEPFEKWQKRVAEKEDGGPGFLGGLKAVPDKLKVVPEKLRAIPAGAGVLVGKLKGQKSGPAQNPYNRQSVRSSVSSVYSVRSNGRSKSISEPPSKLRQQLRGFGDRMPSLKRSRTLLQKKQDSFVAGAKSPFPGIVDDPVLRNSKGTDNPFADPLEPPKTLQLLNPDPNSREGTPKPNQSIWDGLKDQQRGPITPKPVTMSDRGSRDPFASILDELEERDGSGTPEWLRDTSHKRTQSAATALRSHPPSNYTSSVYTTADNPFVDPSEIPPVPSQPLPPNPPRRPSNAYTGLPTFNAMSSAASRESNTSFFFGEPGPSRPTTNMFSEVSAMPRVGRQSDPFDLDRPEVLGFGNVSGRREVRASVTRQNSKSNRRSSVPNWVSVDDGPYERASAVPGPLRNPSVKR